MDINTQISKLRELKALLEEKESIKNKREKQEHILEEYEEECSKVSYDEIAEDNFKKASHQIEEMRKSKNEKKVKTVKGLRILFICVFIALLCVMYALDIGGLNVQIDFDLQLLVTPVIIVFICLLIVFNVIISKVRAKADEKIIYTDEELSLINAAKKKDEEVSQKNIELAVKAEKEQRNKYKYAMDSIKKEINALSDRISAIDKKISSSDVFRGDKNRNLETVSFVLDLLENDRADTIQQALLYYDQYVDKRSREATEEFKAYLDELDRKQRDEKEDEYRRRMIDLEQDRLNEARKARKELEKLNRN